MPTKKKPKVTLNKPAFSGSARRSRLDAMEEAAVNGTKPKPKAKKGKK